VLLNIAVLLNIPVLRNIRVLPNLRRRLETDDRGAALAAVIGLMAVLLLLGATMASVTIGAMAHTSSDRAAVQARAAAEAGHRVTVVTADRFLRARVEGVGALAMSPSWLLDQIG